MAYIIAEPCVGTCDTACVEVCPVDCIHPTKDDWESKLPTLYEELIEMVAESDEALLEAFFDKGELSAEGTHEQLIKISSIYKNFYEKQIRRS